MKWWNFAQLTGWEDWIYKSMVLGVWSWSWDVNTDHDPEEATSFLRNMYNGSAL